VEPAGRGIERRQAAAMGGERGRHEVAHGVDDRDRAGAAVHRVDLPGLRVQRQRLDVGAGRQRLHTAVAAENLDHAQFGEGGVGLAVARVDDDALRPVTLAVSLAIATFAWAQPERPKVLAFFTTAGETDHYLFAQDAMRRLGG